MKIALRLMVLVVAVFGFATASHAAPITYTFSGIASGQFGVSPFTNALVVVTATADTSTVFVQNVDADGDGINDVAIYVNALGLTTVNVAGLGITTVLDPTVIYAMPPIPPEFIEPGEEIFVNPTVWMGTLDSPPALDSATGIAGVSGHPLLGYNLATSIGPIVDTGGVGYPPGLFVNTSSGHLSFNSNFVINSKGTFTATTASVPEPTSLSLLGSGILSIVGLSRFRKRN